MDRNEKRHFDRHGVKVVLHHTNTHPSDPRMDIPGRAVLSPIGYAEGFRFFFLPDHGSLVHHVPAECVQSGMLEFTTEG